MQQFRVVCAKLTTGGNETTSRSMTPTESLRYLPMLRPSPTFARKDFGSNDGRRLVDMARPSLPRVSQERILVSARLSAPKL